MFQIDLRSRKAIYEQIIDNFKRLIITGALKENDKVPSVREMAKTLTVNPNTIQKAYRELETQGYFYIVQGQGSFISSPPKGVNSKELSSLYHQLKELVRQLEYLGISKEEIMIFINNNCTDAENP